jgi:hypothetical protein
MNLPKCPMCEEPLKLRKVIELSKNGFGLTVKIPCECNATIYVNRDGELQSFQPGRTITVRVS